MYDLGDDYIVNEVLVIHKCNHIYIILSLCFTHKSLVLAAAPNAN